MIITAIVLTGYAMLLLIVFIVILLWTIGWGNWLCEYLNKREERK